MPRMLGMRAMRLDGVGVAVEGRQVGHWQQSVRRFSGQLIARRRGEGNGVVPGLKRAQKASCGVKRRRRWSYDEKVRQIEEIVQAAETVCGAARRDRVTSSPLFTWRRQARQGRPGGDAVPALVPVEITPGPDRVSISAPQPSSSPLARRCRSALSLSFTSHCLRSLRNTRVTFVHEW
ncbi:transposase [Bradyrhizobium jicamae]|uniref:transposase n=1 Tax=Bradyrhizobium jicamae TaxID=280332 RepID=UPI0009F8F827